MKHRTSLSLEGWYYIVVLSFIFGGAIIRQINLLMFVAGIMFGPLLMSWWLSKKTLQKLQVKRSLARGVGAGELLVVDLQVQNRRRRGTCYGLVIEDNVRLDASRPDRISSRRYRVPLFVPRLAAGESTAIAYQGRLEERGKYLLGPVQITTRFPLGLLRRTLSIDTVDAIYVYPRLGRLSAAWQQIVQPGRVGSHSTQQRRGFVEGEFHGLRDWQNGDSQRWIHWRTTAKRNALTVKQFERQRNQDIALLVSLQDVGSSDLSTGSPVEAAVRFAATVVANYCRRGSSRVMLGLAQDTPELVGGVTSAGFLQSAMEKLAVVRPTAADRLPELLHHVLREIPRDTRIVIVSTTPTNLTDMRRFAAVWDDPRIRSTLSRIVCLHVGSTEFSACFEESPQAGSLSERIFPQHRGSEGVGV
jgi:uncharacterized protein (DUF58 family)